MGISSGYPVGAKITVDLRKQNLCSKAEAERLLTFTNNSSPLFITGAVATGILGVPQLGLLLLLTHLAGCITVGLLFRFYKPSKTVSHQSSSLRNPVSSLPYQQVRPNIGFYNIGKKLGDAINNSINTLLLICGFIIVFSVFTNILINLKIVYFLACGVKFVFQYIGIAFSLAFPVICGFFEITSGINYINMQFAPIDHKIIIAAFVLGWGGLSVHAQVASIIAHTDISIKPYLFGKLLHGLFSAIYVAMALSTTGLLKTPTSFVFNRMIEMQAAPWRDLEKTSFGMIGLFIGLIGLSYLLRKKIKALDFISKEYMIK
jgi:sporulation integral membrane protein YlbJ